MRCEEFDSLCHEQLDLRAGADLRASAALEEHAAVCAICRTTYLRYQILQQALTVASPPTPPVGFVDRCLAAYDGAPRIFTVRARVLPWVPWAAAAAILVAAVILTRTGANTPIAANPPRGPALANIVEPPRPFVESLSAATQATMVLARETSAPAARIGRQVLDSTSLASPDWGVSLPASDTATLIQSMGDQVEAGVRPFSGTARTAFGFLLPTAPAAPASAKGPAQGA
jgi:hypothetical protein